MTTQREYDVATIEIGDKFHPRTSDGHAHPRAGEMVGIETRLLDAAARQRRELVDGIFDRFPTPEEAGRPRLQSEVEEEMATAEAQRRHALLAEIDAAASKVRPPEAPRELPAEDYQPLSAQAKAEIHAHALTFRAGGPPPGMPDNRVRGQRHFFSETGQSHGIAANFPAPPPGVRLDAALLIALDDSWTALDLDCIRVSPGRPVRYDGGRQG